MSLDPLFSGVASPRSASGLGPILNSSGHPNEIPVNNAALIPADTRTGKIFAALYSKGIVDENGLLRFDDAFLEELELPPLSKISSDAACAILKSDLAPMLKEKEGTTRPTTEDLISALETILKEDKYQIECSGLVLVGGRVKEILCKDLPFLGRVCDLLNVSEVKELINEELFKSIQPPSDSDIHFYLSDQSSDSDVFNLAHDIVDYLISIFDVLSEEILRKKRGVYKFEPNFFGIGLHYAVICFAEKEDPPIEFIIVREMKRKTLFMHEEVQIDLKSTPGIKPVSNKRKAFQSVIDYLTKVVHIERPEEVSEEVWFRLQMLYIQGFTSGSPGAEAALLKSALLTNISGLLRKFRTDHLRRNRLVAIAFCFQGCASLGDRSDPIQKIRDELRSWDWSTPSALESKSVLWSLGEALRSEASMDLISAIIQVAAYSHSLLKLDSTREAGFVFHEGGKRLQFEIDNCCLLLPQSSAAAMTRLKLSLQRNEVPQELLLFLQRLLGKCAPKGSLINWINELVPCDPTFALLMFEGVVRKAHGNGQEKAVRLFSKFASDALRDRDSDGSSPHLVRLAGIAQEILSWKEPGYNTSSDIPVLMFQLSRALEAAGHHDLSLQLILLIRRVKWHQDVYLEGCKKLLGAKGVESAVSYIQFAERAGQWSWDNIFILMQDRPEKKALAAQILKCALEGTLSGDMTQCLNLLGNAVDDPSLWAQAYAKIAESDDTKAKQASWDLLQSKGEENRVFDGRAAERADCWASAIVCSSGGNNFREIFSAVCGKDSPFALFTRQRAFAFRNLLERSMHFISPKNTELAAKVMEIREAIDDPSGDTSESDQALFSLDLTLLRKFLDPSNPSMFLYCVHKAVCMLSSKMKSAKGNIPDGLLDCIYTVLDHIKVLKDNSEACMVIKEIAAELIVLLQTPTIVGQVNWQRVCKSLGKSTDKAVLCQAGSIAVSAMEGKVIMDGGTLAGLLKSLVLHGDTECREIALNCLSHANAAPVLGFARYEVMELYLKLLTDETFLTGNIPLTAGRLEEFLARMQKVIVRIIRQPEGMSFVKISPAPLVLECSDDRQGADGDLREFRSRYINVMINLLNTLVRVLESRNMPDLPSYIMVSGFVRDNMGQILKDFKDQKHRLPPLFESYLFSASPLEDEVFCAHISNCNQLFLSFVQEEVFAMDLNRMLTLWMYLSLQVCDHVNYTAERQGGLLLGLLQKLESFNSQGSTCRALILFSNVHRRVLGSDHVNQEKCFNLIFELMRRNPLPSLLHSQFYQWVGKAVLEASVPRYVEKFFEIMVEITTGEKEEWGTVKDKLEIILCLSQFLSANHISICYQKQRGLYLKLTEKYVKLVAGVLKMKDYGEPFDNPLIRKIYQAISLPIPLENKRRQGQIILQFLEKIAEAGYAGSLKKFVGITRGINNFPQKMKLLAL